jgi:hypothetical protein
LQTGNVCPRATDTASNETSARNPTPLDNDDELPARMITAPTTIRQSQSRLAVVQVYARHRLSSADGKGFRGPANLRAITSIVLRKQRE